MSALPAADDPETGGPTFPFSSDFCFFHDGLDEDDEDESEEDDEVSTR